MVNYFGESVNKVVIPELGREAVLDSVRASQRELESKEIAERNTALDFYYNRNMDKHIEEWFQGKNLSQIPPYPQRLVPRFAKARLMLYKSPPKRLMDGEVNQDYNDIAHQLDSRTREMAEITWLLGDCSFRTKWSDRHERLEYDILPVTKKYYVSGESTPFGVSYEIDRDVKNSRRRFVFWSEARDNQPGMTFLFDQSGKIHPIPGNEEMINPYNSVPISHAKYPSDASDVVRSCVQIGIAMTEIALATRFAIGQPVLVGSYDDMDKNIMAGIDNLITLTEPGSSFQYVSPNGSIKDMIESVKAMLDMTAQNHSLKIRWGDAGQVPSGIALTIMDFENLESRESDIPIWREWEQARYQVDRVVYETHTGKSFPEDLSIDFSEVTYPLSPQEERNWLDWKLEHGIISKKDLMLHFNPDMGDSELASKMEEVKEEQAAEVPPEQPLFEGLRRLGTVGT